MAKPGEEIHVGTTEARSGATPHVTRYVLLFSLVLVIIAFIIVLALWQ